MQIKMVSVIGIALVISSFCKACLGDISSVYSCTDTIPQTRINIEQLKGMWYGIEIINHNMQEQHYVRVDPTCPVIYISDDEKPYNPYGPYDRQYGHGYNYGERRDPNQQGYHDKNLDQEYTRNRQVYHQQYNQRRRYQQRQQHGDEQYGYSTQPYDNDQLYQQNYQQNRQYSRRYPYDRRYDTNTGVIKPYPDEMERLRIWWDQSGVGTEYHVRYKATKPGFWFSSGPRNGSELEPQYSHFAGTIQVLKAVGNHLVLYFCHQMPDRTLFTIILSRETKLEPADIHGVHSLLNRKGLRTTSIRKVCVSGTCGLHVTTWLPLLAGVLYTVLK